MLECVQRGSEKTAFANQYRFHTTFTSSQIMKSKSQLQLHVLKYAKMHTNNYKSSNAVGL